MNAIEKALLAITNRLNEQTNNIIDLSHDLFAIISAIQNQPTMDLDRLEQDFQTARGTVSNPPYPRPTEALLTVLSLRDVVSPPRTLAQRLHDLDVANRMQSLAEDLNNHKP